MAQQRNRTAAVDQETSAFLRTWFTVETPEGNAVAGADRVFDHEAQANAEQALQHLIVETGRPLSVVRYSRQELATYQAVMRVEKVEPEKENSDSK